MEKTSNSSTVSPLSIPVRSNKILTVAAPLAVFILTFLMFVPTLHFQLLQWDDNIEIINNAHIRSLSAANLHWMFTDIALVRRYIPLDWLSWGLNYQLAKSVTGDGLDPQFYHAGNVLLHAMIAAMIFLILRRILRRVAPVAARESLAVTLAAGFGAMFWAVHPLRVEAVAWANSRIHELALFFIAASFLSYLRAFDAPRSRRSHIAWLAASILLYFCSLLSYGTTIGYVAVLLVADVLLLDRWARGESSSETGGKERFWNPQRWRILAEKIPFVGAAAAYVALTLYATYTAHGIFSPPVPLATFGIFDRLMQAAYLVIYYLWKPFASFHFSPVYTTLVSFSPTSFPFVGSLLLALAITVLAFVLRRRFPILLGLWICHLALLFPMLGWTEHPHYPSDRYSYVQGIVIAVALATSILLLILRGRKVVPPTALCALLVGILVAESALTLAQNQVWANSETLFSHMIAELGNDPYRADIYWRRGNVYASQDRFPQALADYNQSIHIQPRNPLPWRFKAILLLKIAAQAEATQPPAQVRLIYLEAAHTLDGLSRTAQSLVTVADAASAYADAGDFPAARQRLEAVIAAAPEDPQFRLLYAKVLAATGLRDQALAQLNAATKLAPKLEQNRQEIIDTWSSPNRPPATTRAAD